MIANTLNVAFIIACLSYEECLDMVANKESFATLIDVNEAAKLQKLIRRKGLRITRFYERSFPYLLFIYTDDSNREEVKKLIECIGKLTQNYLDMVHNLRIPNVMYTTMEISEPVELFTKPPYLGSMILGAIGFLVISGFITDSFLLWLQRRKKSYGKGTLDNFQ